MASQAEPAYQVVWHIDGDDEHTDVSRDSDLENCKSWPTHTKSLCHNCCHSFGTVPVPLPQTYDQTKRIYYCRGFFCSWNCAKSYNLSHTSVIGKGNRNAYISLLAYRLWVKYKHGARSDDSLQRYSKYNILPSPPREQLKAFGGSIDIEDYRKGFFGIVPPEEAVAGKPFVNIRETICKETMVLPFVNLSTHAIQRPPAAGSNRITKNPTNTHKSPFIERTGSCTGVALHKNANDFCTKLNKASSNEAAMLKRKRNDCTKNTLISCMGIVVEKKKK
ncbi:unnamed protein product [Ectocarpus sp. 6 AP-2014]